MSAPEHVDSMPFPFFLRVAFLLRPSTPSKTLSLTVREREREREMFVKYWVVGEGDRRKREGDRRRVGERVIERRGRQKIEGEKGR